jgi:hypothetical protein
MQQRRFLLSLFVPLAFSTATALWACVEGGDSSTASSAGGSGGEGGAGGGSGGSGGSGASGVAEAGPNIVCMLGDPTPLGTDPVAFCTQKLVLLGEHEAAYDATRGVAQSWDSTTHVPDVGPNAMVLHTPNDDAAYGAASARYHHSAMVYGDDEITTTLDLDLIDIVPLLTTELATPPAGYAGELYLDLRTASGGLRLLDRNDLGDEVDSIADACGQAIYDGSYVPLAPAVGDGGVGDGILGTSPGADGGSGVAYAAADVATGALALIDLAARHISDDPTDAAAWQSAAAAALDHLDARARDPVTGLYFAALVTSADPGHDALAPASPSGPPADALLTEVNGRIALAFLRAQALATSVPSAIPAVAALPLEARAEALLGALDNTPQSLWDSSGGPSNGDGGTLGSGYFTGWVPSTQQILTDKSTRANALLLAALHDAVTMGDGPDIARVGALRSVLTDQTLLNTGFLTVVDDQNGYFLTVPSGFDFGGVDAGGNPYQKSYFSSANTAAIEGLSELWVGLPN